MNTEPIGIFDSGSGGITVLNSIAELLPCENYAYVSDSRAGGWGNLPEYEIYSRALTCVKLLIEKKCKIIVAACNTATGVGISKLRHSYGLPFVGIEPAVKPAVAAYPKENITVFCTAATARQSNLRKLITDCGGNVTVRELTGLAAQIESNLYNLEPLKQTVRNIYENNPSHAVVLGCTHYIYLRKYFEEFYGRDRVFDGNSGVAKRVKSLLQEYNALNTCSFSGVSEFYKI